VPPDMKENHEKSMLIICSINESAIKWNTQGKN
jgi:hypothetical protein